MKNGLIIFTLSVVLLQAVYASAEESQNDRYRLNKAYFTGYLLDTKEIITAPSRWEAKDWGSFSLIIGITAGLYAYDLEIQDWVQDKRNDTTDDIAKFAKPFGEGVFTLPPLAVLYLYGHYQNNEKARRVALMSFESYVVTGVFTQFLKFSAHRHRPGSGDSHEVWDGPGFSTDNLSFPSGHSSSAFSVATVIASEYKDYPVVPYVAYSVATLTALSRVNDNDHWASDVFLGSAIGYFTAKAIVGMHSDNEDRRLTLIPVVDADRTALLASYRF